MKPKFVSPCIFSAVLGLSQITLAQTTYSWRAEAADGTWQLADNWWDGAQTAIPAGSDILRFANDAQVTMTNNLAATTRHRIFFDSGTTVSRTITGAAENEFVEVAGNAPMIRNDSTAAHALNFPILINTQNLVVHAATAPLNLGGTISGTAGLLKEGADVLTLSGANTFSGKTLVTAGTVSIDADSRLGSAPVAYVADQLTLDNGTLKTAAGFGISGNRGLTVGVNGATLDNSAAPNNTNFNLNSKITGTGGLTLKANGDTSDSGGGVGGNLSLLNSTNDFTGNITIQSGVVNFPDDGAFGNTANDIVIQGGGLVATGNRTLPATRDIVLSGGGNKIFRAYGSATFTVNGAISGSGNVRHTDGGALVLNGTNSFTGNIDNVRGNLTLANSGHTGNVTNSAGTLVLNAGNTYSGFTHITSSTTLRLDADHALPDGSTVLLYGGTTFNANGKTDTLGSLTTGSSDDTNVIVNLGAGANLTITNNSLPAGLTSGYSNATVAGKITGTGNITYNHATTNNAQWDWANAANDFTGNVTVTQGRLRVISNATTPTDAALGNADNDLIFNGEIVSTLGNQEGKASIQVQNGTNLPLGAGRDVILNNGKEGTMYVWGGTTMTIDGKITGGGNLRKEDGGILLLNNTANDYSGLTRIAAGTIRVGVTGVIPDASGVEIAGGNLDLNNAGETVASLAGTGGAVNGGNTLMVLTSGTAEYAGAIQNATTLHMAGTGTQTIAGTGDNANGWASVASGTLVLGKTSSGAVHAVGRSFGVGLTINGGTAKLGGSGNDQIYQQTDVLQSAGVFDLNGNSEGFRGILGTGGTIRNGVADTFSTMTLGESTTAGDTFNYAGVIENGSGTIELIKTGLGTQILSGANTYTGGTTINGGTLRVEGSLGNTPTVVAATIAGNGSIGAAVNLLAGAGIATAIFNWNGSAGIGFDDLAVQSLVLDSGPHTFTIDTSALANFSETTKTFPILTTTGGIAGFNALDFSISAPGFTGTGTWSVQQTVNTLELVYTASSDPYNAWATAKGLTPANNGKSQDADNDGRTNLQEFAFDGNPLSGANDGKILAGLADPDGAGSETSALMITLPVRAGAVFNGPGDLVSDVLDGVIYQIQGSDDLAAFTSMIITEVTPALVSGMPTLATGWNYRSFRTPGSPAEPDPRDFLRVGVLEVSEP